MRSSLTRPVAPRRVRKPVQGPPGPADPERFVRLLLRVWFEVRAGDRPFAQLVPLLSPALRRRLLAQLPRGVQRREAHTPAKVRRIIVTSPRPQAYDMSVLVEHEHRVTAIAVRLERHHGVWRAIEMTSPEAGFQPLSST